jgi:hypothetical protein
MAKGKPGWKWNHIFIILREHQNENGIQYTLESGKNKIYFYNMNLKFYWNMSKKRKKTIIHDIKGNFAGSNALTCNEIGSKTYMACVTLENIVV